MTQEERIQRINALARKARAGELTAEETAERDELRQAYLKDFRSSLAAQLDNTYIVGPDGTKRKLKKTQKKQKLQ